VSRKTSFVVAGENPGSKFDRAQSLGVRIIDAQALGRLIAERKIPWTDGEPGAAV